MKTKRSSENLETGFQTTFLFCMALLVINRILSGVVNWGFCAGKIHAKLRNKYCVWRNIGRQAKLIFMLLSNTVCRDVLDTGA